MDLVVKVFYDSISHLPFFCFFFGPNKYRLYTVSFRRGDSLSCSRLILSRILLNLKFEKRGWKTEEKIEDTTDYWL